MGRLGPEPKAAVTWTFGSVQAVCMECLGKAVRLDSKRKEDGKSTNHSPLRTPIYRQLQIQVQIQKQMDTVQVRMEGPHTHQTQNQSPRWNKHTPHKKTHAMPPACAMGVLVVYPVRPIHIAAKRRVVIASVRSGGTEDSSTALCSPQGHAPILPFTLESGSAWNHTLSSTLDGYCLIKRSHPPVPWLNYNGYIGLTKQCKA